MMDLILELIHTRKFHEARETLAEMNTVDLAEALIELPQPDLIRVFRMLPKDMAAEVFSYLTRDAQKRIIDTITDQEISEIMTELFLDDTVDMIEEMPANVVKRLLRNTDHKTRTLINQLLQYPEHSAGSIMTVEFVDLRKAMTVRQAFEHIRQTGLDKETIYTGYVTDNQRHLEGLISIKTLLLASLDDLIEDLMDTQYIYASTLDDQEQIAYLFDHYDLLSIPVVDTENRLVGIITVDDALDVLQEENTEDFEKMVAVLPSDKSYLETSIGVHARRRIPWLLFLMVSAIFTGFIITFFEDSLAVMPALVAFIPMLMGTGGNSGSQAATLVIRGLALQEITFSDIVKVFWKEMRISILVGAVLSVINIVRIYLFNHSLQLAITVGLSLYVTVILAKLPGSLLPLLATKLKLDPAIMAAPVITTLVDAGSLLFFFIIAKAILPI
ncbi:MAG: magnesium transporter [Ruminococcaceae bacterium]|nr:magnesium transporter [Oscillospiraceae bacterium]